MVVCHIPSQYYDAFGFGHTTSPFLSGRPFTTPMEVLIAHQEEREGQDDPHRDVERARWLSLARCVV